MKTSQWPQIFKHVYPKLILLVNHHSDSSRFKTPKVQNTEYR